MTTEPTRHFVETRTGNSQYGARLPLQIYEGWVLPSQEGVLPRLVRLTGNGSPPLRLDTNNGSFTIVFNSDDGDTNLGRGFLFSYSRGLCQTVQVLLCLCACLLVGVGERFVQACLCCFCCSLFSSTASPCFQFHCAFSSSDVIKERRTCFQPTAGELFTVDAKESRTVLTVRILVVLNRLRAAQLHSKHEIHRAGCATDRGEVAREV